MILYYMINKIIKLIDIVLISFTVFIASIFLFISYDYSLYVIYSPYFTFLITFFIIIVSHFAFYFSCR